MTSEDRREQEASEIMADHRKGRISARVRDALLRDLGYEVKNPAPRRDYFTTPGSNGRGGVQGKG